MKYKKRVDKNQPAIVKELRQMGYSVELDKDDIIVGKHGKTVWIKIKEKSPFGKNGKLTKGFIKDSQYKILWGWQGQYNICWDVEQIKSIWGTTEKGKEEFYTFGIASSYFRYKYKEWLTKSELNRLRREEIIVDGAKECPFEKFVDGLE